MKKVISFGETMVRYMPLKKNIFSSKNILPCLKSVGGDELNVMIALSNLGVFTKWVSILPHGPLSEYVNNVVKHMNVDIKDCLKITETKNQQIGHYHIIPDLKKVFYERDNSAFAIMKPGLFNWVKIIENINWIHSTGITPMLGQEPLSNWKQSLHVCAKKKIPFSIDLNYRPQLGSIEDLLKYVKPFITNPIYPCKFFIIAESNIIPIAEYFSISIHNKDKVNNYLLL
jgi:2-dehydro-3-deoxygluconokinase